jgi:hypothetical protein
VPSAIGDLLEFLVDGTWNAPTTLTFVGRVLTAIGRRTCQPSIQEAKSTQPTKVGGKYCLSEKLAFAEAV